MALVWLIKVESRRWCSKADRGATLLVLVVLGNPARTRDQGRRRGKTAGALLPDPFAQAGITASARPAFSTPAKLFFKVESAETGVSRHEWGREFESSFLHR